MRGYVIAAVVLATSACVPNVRSGVYACASSSDCPSPVPFCCEGLCHSTPTCDAGPSDDDAGTDAGSDDAGIRDASLPDGRPPPPDGGDLLPCTSTPGCPPGALCIDGACRRPCTRDDECGSPDLRCVGADADGTHGNVCLDHDVGTAPPFYMPCTGSCPAPYVCAEGECVRDCEGGAMQPESLCFDDETCVFTPPGGAMRAVCVRHCGSGSTCPGSARCMGPPPGFTGPNVCLVW